MVLWLLRNLMPAQAGGYPCGPDRWDWRLPLILPSRRNSAILRVRNTAHSASRLHCLPRLIWPVIRAGFAQAALSVRTPPWQPIWHVRISTDFKLPPEKRKSLTVGDTLV